MSERKFKIGDRVIIRKECGEGYILPLRTFAAAGRCGRVVSVLGYAHECGVKFMNTRTGAFLKDVYWLPETDLEAA